MSERDEIKKAIEQVADLERTGEYEKGLSILNKVEERISNLSKKEKCLIWHWRGRIFWSMREYKKVACRLKMAMCFSEKDPVQYGYSAFQLFTCRSDDPEAKNFGGDLKKTRIALIKMFTTLDKPKINGDVFQYLGYLAQKTGKIREAILSYKIAEIFRREAKDEIELAFIWVQIGECHKMIGEREIAKKYGRKALKFFEADPESVHQIESKCF